MEELVLQKQNLETRILLIWPTGEGPGPKEGRYPLGTGPGTQPQHPPRAHSTQGWGSSLLQWDSSLSVQLVVQVLGLSPEFFRNAQAQLPGALPWLTLNIATTSLFPTTSEECWSPLTDLCQFIS